MNRLNTQMEGATDILAVQLGSMLREKLDHELVKAKVEYEQKVADILTDFRDNVMKNVKIQVDRSVIDGHTNVSLNLTLPDNLLQQTR